MGGAFSVTNKRAECNNLQSTMFPIEAQPVDELKIEIAKRPIEVLKPKRRIKQMSTRPALSINGNTKEKLLTREEEHNLSSSIRALHKAIRVRDKLMEPSVLEWADACGVTVNQLRRIMMEGKEARSLLVAKNAGLVVQISKRYHVGSSSLTMQDMIQEGNLGLMEAAER